MRYRNEPVCLPKTCDCCGAPSPKIVIFDAKLGALWFSGTIKFVTCLVLFVLGLSLLKPSGANPWVVAHNAKIAIKQSSVKNSPLSLGGSFKIYYELYSNLGESFEFK